MEIFGTQALFTRKVNREAQKDCHNCLYPWHLCNPLSILLRFLGLWVFIFFYFCTPALPPPQKNLMILGFAFSAVTALLWVSQFTNETRHTIT